MVYARQWVQLVQKWAFQPSRVQGFSYEAPTIASQIEQFRNPFEQQVVEGALGDIERQRQMQANQLAAQFGRHEVLVARVKLSKRQS